MYIYIAGSDVDRWFRRLDDVLLYLFSLELLVNLVANWFWNFWTDGWAVFDFVVVAIGWLAALFGDVPGVSA